MVGWNKGFKPYPKFDPKFYLSTYPDVAQAGMNRLLISSSKAGLKDELRVLKI